MIYPVQGEIGMSPFSSSPMMESVRVDACHLTCLFTSHLANSFIELLLFSPSLTSPSAPAYAHPPSLHTFRQDSSTVEFITPQTLSAEKVAPPTATTMSAMDWTPSKNNNDRRIVKVPSNSTNTILGANGTNKTAIENQSGCRIYINIQSSGKIELEGSAAQQDIAERLIRQSISASKKRSAPEGDTVKCRL